MGKYQDVKAFAYPILHRANPFSFNVFGAWIGLRHDTSVSGTVYRYTDGQEATFFRWDHNEPNAIRTDNCIRLSLDHFMMRTGGCDVDHVFICETMTTPVTTLPSSGETCLMKRDCQSHCSSSEYHCVEYECKCGSIGHIV